MSDIKRDDLVKDAKKFCEYGTYVFIKTISGTFYNGYIASVPNKEELIFIDDEIHVPFPIRLESVKLLVPSIKKGSDYNFGRRGL